MGYGYDYDDVPRDWIPHKSHAMGKEYSDIRSPTGNSPRFYGVQECKKCGGEVLSHPAGRFADFILRRECEVAAIQKEQYD